MSDGSMMHSKIKKTSRFNVLCVRNPCRLAAAVALDTGKFIKKHLSVFERGEVQHCSREKAAFL